MTGTPELFDTRRGVAGLAPLHDRIRFLSSGGFSSLRQPQLELKPFDAPRLFEVAVRLRELYPAEDRARLAARVTDAFVGRLVEDVTAGFRGDVGVVPRQFVRALVHHMDLVDEHEDYDPSSAAGFEPADLRPEEQEAATGELAAIAPEDATDELLPVRDVW